MGKWSTFQSLSSFLGGALGARKNVLKLDFSMHLYKSTDNYKENYSIELELTNLFFSGLWKVS